jgi:hypothetical protein
LAGLDEAEEVIGGKLRAQGNREVAETVPNQDQAVRLDSEVETRECMKPTENDAGFRRCRPWSLTAASRETCGMVDGAWFENRWMAVA